jgi:8-oxo-dGTP diphosphatase
MGKKVCAGGFLIKKQQFLFGKRANSKSWAPGVWDIPGGKSLKNEHPFLTLKRELSEETGIEVLNADLLLSLDISDDEPGGGFKYYIYMVTEYKGKPINSSEEHTELRWFTRKELNDIEMALPVYLVLIDNWLTSANRS